MMMLIQLQGRGIISDFDFLLAFSVFIKLKQIKFWFSKTGKKANVVKSNKSKNSLPFEPMMLHLGLRAFCTQTILCVGFWWAPCSLPG